MSTGEYSDDGWGSPPKRTESIVSNVQATLPMAGDFSQVQMKSVFQLSDSEPSNTSRLAESGLADKMIKEKTHFVGKSVFADDSNEKSYGAASTTYTKPIDRTVPESAPPSEYRILGNRQEPVPLKTSVFAESKSQTASLNDTVSNREEPVYFPKRADDIQITAPKNEQSLQDVSVEQAANNLNVPGQLLSTAAADTLTFCVVGLLEIIEAAGKKAAEVLTGYRARVNQTH